MTENLFLLQGISKENINLIIDSYFQSLELFLIPANTNPIGFSFSSGKKNPNVQLANPLMTEKKIGFLNTNVEKEHYGRTKPIALTTQTHIKSVGFLTLNHNTIHNNPPTKLPTIGFIQQGEVDVNYRNKLIFRSVLGIFEIKSSRSQIGF